MAAAAILDVDGTLVDTNYHHAIAWYRAFRRHGVVAPERAVPRDRVVVVRVDERPVDVEDRSGRHRGHPKAPRGGCQM